MCFQCLPPLFLVIPPPLFVLSNITLWGCKEMPLATGKSLSPSSSHAPNLSLLLPFSLPLVLVCIGVVPRDLSLCEAQGGVPFFRRFFFFCIAVQYQIANVAE